jgi:hypothetical protein
LERKAPSGKVEVHLLPGIALQDEETRTHEAAGAVEVEVVGNTSSTSTGGQAYRYQSDKVIARTHAFDDAFTRTGERLAERFGFPGMGSMHIHGEKLYCVARVCVKADTSSIDELGVYVQGTVGSGQPRTRYHLSSAIIRGRKRITRVGAVVIGIGILYPN